MKWWRLIILGIISLKLNMEVRRMERETNIYDYIQEVSKIDEKDRRAISKELSKYSKDELLFMLPIITNESNFNKFAIGDNGNSIGLGQISIYKGENNDKTSTMEMIILNNPQSGYNFNFLYELQKYKNGELDSCKLFDIKVQLKLISDYIKMIKLKIIKSTDNYIEPTLKNISYLYNAGINSNIDNINIWLSNYNYYDNVTYYYMILTKNFL